MHFQKYPDTCGQGPSPHKRMLVLQQVCQKELLKNLDVISKIVPVNRLKMVLEDMIMSLIQTKVRSLFTKYWEQSLISTKLNIVRKIGSILKRKHWFF